MVSDNKFVTDLFPKSYGLPYIFVVVQFTYCYSLLNKNTHAFYSVCFDQVKIFFINVYMTLILYTLSQRLRNPVK